MAKLFELIEPEKSVIVELLDKEGNVLMEAEWAKYHSYGWCLLHPGQRPVYVTPYVLFSDKWRIKVT
jgi:hypothetical protein